MSLQLLYITSEHWVVMACNVILKYNNEPINWQVMFDLHGPLISLFPLSYCLLNMMSHQMRLWCLQQPLINRSIWGEKSLRGKHNNWVVWGMTSAKAKCDKGVIHEGNDVIYQKWSMGSDRKSNSNFEI